MARKEYEEFEAVSAVMPGEEGYRAAIAVKARAGGAPRFHAVLPGQTFKTAHEADLAASAELERLASVDAEGELVW
ncbi:hypothetical protein [Pseudomonas viridiflava]|uniref:hypothetical protein n=1 Tax=Pseudomonas viridiflava TaxID=33069 RepID=UPI000F01A071|nr:hypothetical protein [Pseudomonas viridiflava]MEE3914496.1 hypothetical protein [Pseudomonas viridiflava]MEE3973465.1 hypothetical protein [Pseudomonas viridiflava]MEE4018235.1 hypothetical protein [Pseudomonas viridiflava]MEE4046781.1 hypothetical protein [Pseudomonas viridiflava]